MCSLVTIVILVLQFTTILTTHIPTNAPKQVARDPEIRPCVLCLYVGGTIGMVKDETGEYVPSPGYLEEVVSSLPCFSADDVPLFTIREYDVLMDSSNMKPEDWLVIARDIAEAYDDYSGFVVIHGTDTLSYTASALSFLLPNLSKPVILTGSQIPLAETYNDGVFNLLGSILLAGWYDIPEVGLFFAGKLYRGNRAQKYSAWQLDAFASGAYPPLATMGVSIFVNTDKIRKVEPAQKPVVQNAVSSAVGIVRLYPGFSGSDLLSAAMGKDGLVLLAFGSGNGPSSDLKFVEALETLHKQGLVIVDATQTFWGMVDLGLYETGGAMRRAGVISAYTMTPEAAYTKLAVLLGQDIDQDTVETLFQSDLAGELDLPAIESRAM